MADRYPRFLRVLVVTVITHLTASQQRLTETLNSLEFRADRSTRTIVLMNILLRT